MPDSKAAPPDRPKFFPIPAAFSCGCREEASQLPVVKNIPRRSLILCAFSIFLLLPQFSGLATAVHAQGFGLSKKTVKLQRKMPATVHLPGPGFDVQVNAHDSGNADAAHMLSDLLTIELQKYDKKLQVKPTSPDEVIHCTIMTFQIPPPVSYTRNEVVMQKGRSLEQPVQYYKVTGAVSVTYQAKDSQARVLDSDGVTANYSQEFQAGTNQATGESLESKVTNPFKRLAGKKTDESYGAPSPIELRQLLLSRAASQIASRLVNTDETLDVPLARGKLDEANNLAEKGLWERYLETLETMTPLPKTTEEAYRFYDIGVAYEALAYQSEDKNATAKFLEKAAINYGKAIDANPGEKLFAEPQNRIETAVSHYKRLQGGSTMEAKADAAPASAPTSSPASASKSSTPGKSASPGAGSRSASVGTSKPPANAGASPAAGAASKAPAKAPANAAPALTNAQVIKMAKAGVDEDNIVATIHDATSVQFDLSPDGLVDLASNGVKGKIVIAMRERAKRSSPRQLM
jgi:hypothetical protein